ncbi:DUF3991 and TOPRIM domain-containing protein [Papillibacter cinnamivorans]|uniref:Toprim-like n=1 Tax=Papillibacter cinnamivorans DSM 12816 TaxID=1122930 RepID=A0A1W2AQG4_9FIRM|nr:DUF3991 and TOPRIM domain-containing protein [Papillibacter cinnamivorans]SMC62448.1 Toprim-like [Papillibacter cinnamivorans DSM 12816]
MAYISAEDITQAKQMDLLTYLQSYEPQELVRMSGNTYCTREHDSLKISNGKWHWFSREIGGKTALDYLIKVRDYTFLQAVETLLGRAATNPPVFITLKPEPERTLLMPELSENTDRVERYLKSRGIHPVIVDYCLENKLLFESKDYHNALFIGYDSSGKARYSSVRGTIGAYKGELSGSDKRYSFSIPGKSDTVHVFESAIDLLSFATLELLEGRDWHGDGLLSLAGVYKTKRRDVVPIALEQYLNDHPGIKTLRLHLDNDEVGLGAVAGIVSGLDRRYQVYDEPPKCGKDVNDQLKIKVGIKNKEDYSR